MDTEHQPTSTPDAAEGLPAADAPATPVDDYADFSRIFDELNALPEPTKDTNTSPVALEDAAKAKPEAAKPEEPTPVATEAETSAPVEEPAPEPASDTAAEDWEKKYKEFKAEADAYKATVEKDVAERTKAPPPERKPEPEPELYDKDEKEFLDQYGKDWPEVVKGEQLRRRAEYRQVAAHIFGEINRVYGPVLERAVATADQVADNTLLGTVRDAHPDYDVKMYDELTAWAGGLTGFKGKLAKEVIAQGEPQDVVDLIADFKRETGKSKPVVVAPAAKLAPKAVAPLTDAAKKAAKALGVVESKRSAVTQAADPNDFEAAWREATAQ